VGDGFGLWRGGSGEREIMRNKRGEGKKEREDRWRGIDHRLIRRE
jgi:hypothetical protein